MYKHFTTNHFNNRIQYFKNETIAKLKQAKRSVSLDPKKLRRGFSYNMVGRDLKNFSETESKRKEADKISKSVSKTTEGT